MLKFFKNFFKKKTEPSNDAALQLCYYTIEGLQTSIGLMQSNYNRLLLDINNVMCALVLMNGGEINLQHKFIDIVKEQNLSLVIEKDGDSGTKYSVKSTETENQETKSE